MSKSQIVEIEGKHLRLTNLDKVLYPATGFTKGQVIDYYARIAPVLVPHLLGRPLTLKRYPDGVDKEYFFEKNATKHRPDWVKTAPIWSEGNQRNVNYILANDLPTLVWMANLAAHRTASVAFAGERHSVSTHDGVRSRSRSRPRISCNAARSESGCGKFSSISACKVFPRRQAPKGLQIYVPLNTPTSYDVTKPFAHALARLLENEHRDLVVSDMKKELRVGKVLVDWSQNDEHKTTIAFIRCGRASIRRFRRR